MSKITVGATSTAGIDMGETEIWAAIDMSASLGIAATPQARSDLEALTRPYMPAGHEDPQGCQFACHQRAGWEPAGKTVYQMATEAAIPLREDVLNAAFAAFVDNFMKASDPAVAANRKRMAVIGFSDDAQQLVSPTNDTATVKLAPQAFPNTSRINTKFAPSLTTVRDLMGAQGNGMAGKPRKTLLLITDGMGWDHSGNLSFDGAIDTNLCDTFKKDGITVAVIEVKYQDATGEYNFNAYVAGLYPKVSPAIQACASPGYYFQATDSDATTLGQTFSQTADALRTKLALRQ